MDVDVCIVGSGLAGALMAADLATAGRSVVVLETGERVDETDPERYERARRGLNPWNWLDPLRDACEVESPYAHDFNRSRTKVVGGTTLEWNAYAPRLKPADYKMRSLYGIGADWPVTYDELEPYMIRMEKELGVAGGDTPNGPPRSEPFPLPPHEYSYADKEFFFPAFARLGLEWGPNPMAINSVDFGGRPACEGFATCTPMCPINSRYTALEHIRKAERTGNTRVLAGCHARRIRLSSRRTVGGVEYIDATGSHQFQGAQVVVLATGGVEVPRLLLLSAVAGSHPNGLANSSGLVGRYFMTNTLAAVRGSLRERVGGHRLGFGTSVSWTMYDYSRLPDSGNMTIFPSDLQGPVPGDLARNAGLWGKQLKKYVQDNYGFNVKVICEGEMLPSLHNRVELSGETRDRFGDPIPRVIIRNSAFEEATIDKGIEIGRKAFELMSARTVWTNRGYFLSHMMGTTKMGEDSSMSVCDGYGRCHDLDNLYVASSSLFPTTGGTHPSPTMAALALRTAEFIHRAI
ncbi:MAG: GMC family oxidoreductase [Bacteroidota bacterium]